MAVSCFDCEFFVHLTLLGQGLLSLQQVRQQLLEEWSREELEAGQCAGRFDCWAIRTVEQSGEKGHEFKACEGGLRLHTDLL